MRYGKTTRWRNHYRGQNQQPVTLPDLEFPELGTAIGYYTYARYTENESYYDCADQIMETILSQVSRNTPVGGIRGLSSLSRGIAYLFQNDYLDGDEAVILREIKERMQNI